MNTSVCLESINQTNLRAKGQKNKVKTKFNRKGSNVHHKKLKRRNFFISQSYYIAKRQDFTVDTVTKQTIKAWAQMV